MLNELFDRAYNTAEEKGFHDLSHMSPDAMKRAIKIGLIASEIGEAINADREGNMTALAEELADMIIRIGDLASFCKFDMDAVVAAKMAKNDARPFRHNRSY